MPFLLSTDTIRRLNDALVPAGLATPDARGELPQGIHPVSWPHSRGVAVRSTRSSPTWRR